MNDNKKNFPAAEELRFGFKIPENGSISLLAFGHEGVLAWKKMLKESAEKKQDKK